MGGAFNPPHEGHLALARAAHSQLGLDRVILLVTAQAPHKAIESDPGPEARLELAQAATGSEPWLEASRIELDRPGPSYTYLSLEQIAEAHPGAEIWLVLGMDAAASLPDWERPDRVLALAGIAVAGRPDADLSFEGLRERLAAIPGLESEPRLVELQMRPIAASSTAAREAMVNGADPGDVVPGVVAKVIDDRDLYG